MKKTLFWGVTIMVTLLSVSSCSCPDEENLYNKKFTYKPGDFVYHKVSEDKILITDTMRYYDCTSETDIELIYTGINSSENENTYSEIELRRQ
jgi:hypothetical protein